MTKNRVAEKDVRQLWLQRLNGAENTQNRHVLRASKLMFWISLGMEDIMMWSILTSCEIRSKQVQTRLGRYPWMSTEVVLTS